MTVKVGDSIPSVTVTALGAEGPGPLDTADLFKGKTVALFGVPGAFTPTCSAQHLPGFVSKAGDLKAKGVDEIVCMSVNDMFVMKSWAEAQGAGDAVTMLPDGNGAFTEALGLAFDASAFGMATRCQRFSLVAKDGKVTAINIEEPGAFEVSGADTLLGQL